MACAFSELSIVKPRKIRVRVVFDVLEKYCNIY